MVAALHVVVGAMLVLDALAVLVQVRLAVTWELGFYGRVSPLSQVLGITAILVLGVALLGVGTALRYALGQTGGQGVLLASLLLMCVVPEPIAWALLGANLAVVFDPARRRLAALRDDDDGP